MSAFQAQRSYSVLTLAGSGYRGKLNLKLNSQTAPVTFVWWAATPTGRDSVHTQTFTFERMSCTSHARIGEDGVAHAVYVPTFYWGKSIQELYEIAKARSHALLKNLPRGYVWYGPYLHSVINPESGGNAREESFGRNAKAVLAAQLARQALLNLSPGQLARA